MYDLESFSDTPYLMRIEAARGLNLISRASWEADPRAERLGVSDQWLYYGKITNQNDLTAQRIYNSIFGINTWADQRPPTVEWHGRNTWKKY